MNILLDIDKVSSNKNIKGIFLIFLALMGNFLAPTLSCNIQTLFMNNIIAKHFIVFLLIFYTIHIFYDDEVDIITLFLNSFIIYILFILFSKQQLYFSYAIILMMFVEYLIYASISYNEKKLKNNETSNNKLNNEIKKLKQLSNIIAYLILFILIIGFISYYNKQKNSYKNNFDIIKFIFGVNKCKNN